LSEIGDVDNSGEVVLVWRDAVDACWGCWDVG